MQSQAPGKAGRSPRSRSGLLLGRWPRNGPACPAERGWGHTRSRGRGLGKRLGEGNASGGGRLAPPRCRTDSASPPTWPPRPQPPGPSKAAASCCRGQGAARAERLPSHAPAPTPARRGGSSGADAGSMRGRGRRRPDLPSRLTPPLGTGAQCRLVTPERREPAALGRGGLEGSDPAGLGQDWGLTPLFASPGEQPLAGVAGGSRNVFAQASQTHLQVLPSATGNWPFCPFPPTA